MIAVLNDKTRPVPHQHLLPPLMDRLNLMGISDEVISFYVAVGTHAPMTEDEFPSILPDSILQRYKVVSQNQKIRNADLPRRDLARDAGLDELKLCPGRF